MTTYILYESDELQSSKNQTSYFSSVAIYKKEMAKNKGFNLKWS